MRTDLIGTKGDFFASNKASALFANATARLFGVRMHKLLAAAAVAIMATTSAAYATTIDVSYQVSYSSNNYSYFTPSIYGNLGNWNHSTHTGTDVENFAASGQSNGPFGFLTLTPNGNCYHCVITGTVSVNFSFTDETTGTSVNNLVETGTYLAQYGGNNVQSCSGKSGFTDCIDWNVTNPIPVDLSNNSLSDTLYVTLSNADDWSIYPKIGFQFVSLSKATAAPLPASLPLFVTGAGVIGFFGWKSKKRAGKGSKAAA
jgi:hypothetical protein